MIKMHATYNKYEWCVSVHVQSMKCVLNGRIFTPRNCDLQLYGRIFTPRKCEEITELTSSQSLTSSHSLTSIYCLVMEPQQKRARRECPICKKTYAKLTDHLTRIHQLDTKEKRKPYMDEAKANTPDLRLISKPPKLNMHQQ